MSPPFSTLNNPPGVLLRDLGIDRHGPLFESFSLELPAGQWTCLLGASGVGKTTLLRLLAGLETSTTGSIQATDGQALTGRVAYMAQQDLLLPWLTVLDNICLGARLRGERYPMAQAHELLQQLGLEGLAKRLPATLSGGQRQRVALARTLLEARPLVLMDEPFVALDALGRHRLQNLAARLLAGRTVLLVTHDPLEALRLGEQILVLQGRPVQLKPISAPPGDPPRQTDDRHLMQQHQRLLEVLGETP